MVTQWFNARAARFDSGPRGASPCPGLPDRLVVRLSHPAPCRKLIFRKAAAQRINRYPERHPLMAPKPRMPRGLGTEGQKLWKSVIGEFDLAAEPHKLRILF